MTKARLLKNRRIILKSLYQSNFFFFGNYNFIVKIAIIL